MCICVFVKTKIKGGGSTSLPIYIWIYLILIPSPKIVINLSGSMNSCKLWYKKTRNNWLLLYKVDWAIGGERGGGAD